MTVEEERSGASARGRLEVHVLRSGDHGVCLAVRDAWSEDVVCVDCGVSGQTFSAACKEAGLNPFKVRAFLVTHGHGNQVKGFKSVLSWLAKRGVQPAVYVEPGVLAATTGLQELADMCDLREFATKRPFDVGSIRVRPFRTFHNNEDKGSCYNFRFEAGAEGPGCDAVAILSDAGVLSREAQGELGGVRVLGVEANYDQEMLAQAAESNKALRFAVDTRGNFSNAQAAAVVREYAWRGLQDVVAMYVSRQHNTPELACAALRGALDEAGCLARVHCTSGDEALSVLPCENGVPGEFDEVLAAGDAAAAGLRTLGDLASLWAGDVDGAEGLDRLMREKGLVEAIDGFPTQAALTMGAWVAARRSGAGDAVEAFPVFPEAALGLLRRRLFGEDAGGAGR